MILLFWQVLGAHYEIAESVLSLEAVQDTPAISLDWPVTEYSLQLDDLHVHVYENPRLVFIYEISTTLNWFLLL